MRLKRKIPAFTIMEMLVTMSLSAIAIVCAYMAYNSIFGSFINYQKMNAEIKEYTNLYRFTQSLTSRAHHLQLHENKIIFDENNTTIAELAVNGTDFLLQTNDGQTDTLSVNAVSAEAWFGKNKVNENGNVSKFLLQTEFNKQPFTLTFEKLYDAETLMRLDSIQKNSSRE